MVIEGTSTAASTNDNHLKNNGKILNLRINAKSDFETHSSPSLKECGFTPGK